MPTPKSCFDDDTQNSRRRFASRAESTEVSKVLSGTAESQESLTRELDWGNRRFAIEMATTTVKTAHAQSVAEKTFRLSVVTAQD
jgi:hypothetical protein